MGCANLSAMQPMGCANLSAERWHCALYKDHVLVAIYIAIVQVANAINSPR